MTSAVTQNTAELAKAHVPSADIQGTAAELRAGRGSINVDKYPVSSLPGYASSEEEYDDKPTEEELHTLRRVSGKLQWRVWTIAFAELCERFSYYGSAVLYTNFVQRPLPPGSTTGASQGTTARVPGALGMGQKASQGLSLFNQFFAYIMPLVGKTQDRLQLGQASQLTAVLQAHTLPMPSSVDTSQSTSQLPSRQLPMSFSPSPPPRRLSRAQIGPSRHSSLAF
jgi:POT family proton-dependent oligopeptide transporter